MIPLLCLSSFRPTAMSQKKMKGKQLIWILWMTSLSSMTGGLKVQVEPKSVVKHVNESLELVCTALDCSDEPKYTWMVLMDTTTGGKMESGQTSSRRVYNRLTTEDEQTILCKVDCRGHGEAKAKIKVYSFPRDPVISRLNHSTLMCTVDSVFPLDMFKLDWLRGETHLSSWECPPEYGKGEQDIQSLYTTSEEDHGKDIICRVTLSLEGVPEDHKVRSVTAQYGPAFMNISSNIAVKIGERVELKCDADGKSSITWKKLEKSEAIPFSTNKLNVIENATLAHAGVYECEASTELASRRATVRVTVKSPPNVPIIRLSQAGNPKAGDNVTIMCNSDSPLRLTISGTSLNRVEKHSSAISVNLPSIQLTDSGLYHCEAQNEFGSKSSSVNVTVRAPPRNSTVLVYPSAQVMEAQNITIHCSTVSFPPASISLRREEDGAGFLSANGIFHLFNIKSEDKGFYTVNFTNELGYETQTFKIFVKEQQSILTKTLIPSVSSISLLTAAALLMRHLRRVKNKGSFVPSLDNALEVL